MSLLKPTRSGLICGSAIAVGMGLSVVSEQSAISFQNRTPPASAIVATSDREEICGVVDGKSYSRRHRDVPERVKIAVYLRARVAPSGRFDKDERGRPLFEVDHICPLDIGCSNDISNLQLEIGTGSWNYHDKDRVEAEAKRQICEDGRDPGEVQAWFITGDWRAKYVELFGSAPNDAE